MSVPPIPEVTEAQRREAQKAAALAANDPANLTQLQRDVASLVGQNRIIQDKFIEVSLKLKEIDTGKLPDGSPINPGEPFNPPWEELRVKFDTLVNRSNDTASTIGTYCKTFNTIILPFSLGMNDGPPLTKPEKLALLNSFQESADEFHKEATRTKDDFDKFSAEVTLFSARFQGFAVDRIEDNRALLIQADNRIRTLQSEIDQLNFQINALLIAIGVTAVGTAIGAAIFPGFGLLIALAGAAAVIGMVIAVTVLANQVAEKEGEIAHQNRVKEELMAIIAQLQAAQAVLGGITTDDIPTITGALSAFSGVWQQVIGSINEVKTYLDLAPGVIDIPPVVSAYLLTAQSVYGPLGDGLLDYAKGIHGPDTSTREDRLKARKSLPKWASISPAIHKEVVKFVDHRGKYATF